MIQSTSREAYAKISQFLGEKQSVVLGVLRDNEPMTNNELAESLRWSINRVTPRVNELVSMGLVRMYERRRCGVTGFSAIAWTPKKILSI